MCYVTAKVLTDNNVPCVAMLDIQLLFQHTSNFTFQLMSLDCL